MVGIKIVSNQKLFTVNNLELYLKVCLSFLIIEFFINRLFSRESGAFLLSMNLKPIYDFLNFLGQYSLIMVTILILICFLSFIIVTLSSTDKSKSAQFLVILIIILLAISVLMLINTILGLSNYYFDIIFDLLILLVVNSSFSIFFMKFRQTDNVDTRFSQKGSIIAKIIYLTICFLLVGIFNLSFYYVISTDLNKIYNYNLPFSLELLSIAQLFLFLSGFLIFIFSLVIVYNDTSFIHIKTAIFYVIILFINGLLLILANSGLVLGSGETPLPVDEIIALTLLFIFGYTGDLNLNMIFLSFIFFWIGIWIIHSKREISGNVLIRDLKLALIFVFFIGFMYVQSSLLNYALLYVILWIQLTFNLFFPSNKKISVN